MQRVARDGHAYNFASFVEHYGGDRAQYMWDEAIAATYYHDYARNDVTPSCTLMKRRRKKVRRKNKQRTDAIEIDTEGWRCFVHKKGEDQWMGQLRAGNYAVECYVRSWQSERNDYEADTIFDEILYPLSPTGRASVGLNSSVIEKIKAKDMCWKNIELTDALRVEQTAAKRQMVVHFFAYHIAMGRMTRDGNEWKLCSCCGCIVCSSPRPLADWQL